MTKQEQNAIIIEKMQEQLSLDSNVQENLALHYTAWVRDLVSQAAAQLKGEAAAQGGGEQGGGQPQGGEQGGGQPQGQAA